MSELSAKFVDKYLKRIQENRGLKENTIIGSTEAKMELDASKIVYIPSTIQATKAVGLVEGNSEVLFDFNVDETILEVIERKNAFTLNCAVTEGVSNKKACSLTDLSCKYDDFNPAAQKGVYVPLNNKKPVQEIILLGDINN